MDFLALFITGKLLRIKAGTAALVISAALGSVYAVASLFLPGNAVMSFFISVAVSLLMCYIAYGTSLGSFLISALLFYLVNFIMGGGITALYNLLNRSIGAKSFYINGQIHEYSSEIPLLWFIILAAVSALFSYIYGRVSERFGFGAKKRVSRVRLIYRGLETEFEGLRDSGNLLCEPIGGLPVIITDYKTLEPVLPCSFRPFFCGKEARAEDFEALGIEAVRRIRIIPISTVGHSGIILGFVPDVVTVDGIEREACIAVAPEGAHDFGGYPSLVPRELTVG